ncbi:hypothetical protein Barb6_03469 [Bacteroidales bacterium Barb6]|nr:hypothetical protein Barb6_03469 [Bacteroidales bacterium Barb6]OAV75931.1 hypothetical protein Barb7_00416 [Bacteroidales bacterium Barb7]
MTKVIKLSSLVQDDKNFNRHTAEGMELLENSIRKTGIIESITVSSDNKIISGNARQEKMREVLGDAVPIIVDTDGTKPIIIRRSDIHSDTKEFYEAAILANTVSKNNINLNDNLIRSVAVEQYDIQVEDLGVGEIITEKQLKEINDAKTMEIVAYRKVHVLLSFSPEKMIEIQDILKQLKENPDIEYEQGAN